MFNKCPRKNELNRGVAGGRDLRSRVVNGSLDGIRFAERSGYGINGREFWASSASRAVAKDASCLRHSPLRDTLRNCEFTVSRRSIDSHQGIHEHIPKIYITGLKMSKTDRIYQKISV